MIIDELINDIDLAIKLYVKKFASVNQVPESRRVDIAMIKNILKYSDAILICQKLNDYLDSISIKVFRWITFIDLNYFVSLFRGVLGKSKYQELNLLHSLIKEKDQIIKDYEEKRSEKNHKIDQNVEAQLLKSENNYLYSILENLDKRLTALESENAINLRRALNAENTLKNCMENQGRVTTVNYNESVPVLS